MEEVDESFSFLESEPSLLDMSASYYRRESKKKTKNRLLYLAIYFIAIIAVEYLSRSRLKEFSIDYFGSSDPSRCYALNYLEFYSYGGRYVLLFLVLNYVNVYAALCLIFLDSFGLALNGIIRFFYLEPRPFWENPDLFPCFCATDYSNPSTTGTNMFMIFASFYRIMTLKSRNAFFKISLMLICAFFVASTCLMRVIQNVDYLHQILFGIGLGGGIHYWFYYILKVDIYNRKQFKQIITQPIIVATLTIACWGVINIIHFNTHFQTKPIYIINIEKYCEINNFFSFDKESYVKSIQIFEFFGCYIGIFLEYIITFRGNCSLMMKYNIKSKHAEMFNCTDALSSFVRFLLFYLIQVLFFSKFIIKKINYDSFQGSPTYLLIAAVFIPVFLQGIFFFYVLKRVVVYVKLTNENLFHLDNEKHVPDYIN